MALLETAHWTDEQWSSFIDECFRQWLNIVDARLGYNERRNAAPVNVWRELFDDGECENDAIRWLTQ